MKRFFAFLILILFFNTTTNAYAMGGLQQFFKALFNFFKSSTNNVIKTGDDLFKNLGKINEEFLSGTKSSKGADKTILTFGSKKNTKIDLKDLTDVENIFDREE